MFSQHFVYGAYLPFIIPFIQSFEYLTSRVSEPFPSKTRPRRPFLSRTPNFAFSTFRRFSLPFLASYPLADGKEYLFVCIPYLQL